MKRTLTASNRILLLKRKTTEDSANLIDFNKSVYDRVMSETQSEATVVRMAKGLSAFLHEKDISVDEADLFAGRSRMVYCMYSHPYRNENELNAILEGPHAAAVSFETGVLEDEVFSGKSFSSRLLSSRSPGRGQERPER